MAKAKAKARTRTRTAAKPKMGRQAADDAKRSAKKKAAKPKTVAPDPTLPGPNPLFRSLRTAIYQVPEVARAKAFYTPALGREPYFDQPFYVGYDVDGFELGLQPAASARKPGPGGVVAYWRVDDIHASLTHLILLGATTVEAPHDVGDKIQVAIASDPFGNSLGLIQIES